MRAHSNVRIVAANIPPTAVAHRLPSAYRVAQNIPNILTVALLAQLLEQPRPPSRIDLLVQQEVAERIVAPPGAWSLATLSVRVFGHPELVLRVPRSAFPPPPRVDSALVRILPDEEPALPRVILPSFFVFLP